MIEHGPCPRCGSDEEKVVVLKGELAKACAKCGYIYYLWKDYCSMSDAQKDIDSLSVGQIEDALQTRIAALSTRIAEFEAENKWLKAKYERLKAIAEQLEKEIARRDEELLELNNKAVFIKFENEDELPAEIKDDVYSAMFECSHVDGVRLFPYIEENGQKYFLVMLKEDV